MNKELDDLMSFLDNDIIKTVDVEETATIKQEIQPTPHQLEKLHEIADWLNTEGDLFRVLDGAGGTGKTTVIKFLILNLVNYDTRLNITKRVSSEEICLAAPTHKALGVLKQKVDISVETSTVASLVGLRPNDNLEHFDPTKSDFIIKSTEIMAQYDIIIIDEASMINSEVLEHITKIARKHSIKILFVGDSIQLPPVGEYYSPAFVYPAITLTEIIRQKDTNPLTYLLAILRADIIRIMNGGEIRYDWTTILSKQPEFTNDNNEGYKSISFIDMPLTLHHYKENVYGTKYITFTNDDVAVANRLIRQYLYDNATDFILTGEILMSYTTSEPDAPCSITNSIDYEVLSVKDDTLLFTYKHFRIPGTKGYKDFEVDKLVHIKSPSQQEKGLVEIQGYSCELKDLNTGDIQTCFIPDKSAYPIIAKEHFTYFNSDNKGFANWNLKKMYGTYKQFRNKFTLLTNIYRTSDGNFTHIGKDKDFKALTKDIDRAYGITTHKSQGSTYNTDIVNVKEILANLQLAINPNIYYARYSKPITDEDIRNEIIFHNKLIYVALSRVTQFSYLITK